MAVIGSVHQYQVFPRASIAALTLTVHGNQLGERCASVKAFPRTVVNVMSAIGAKKRYIGQLWTPTLFIAAAFLRRYGAVCDFKMMRTKAHLIKKPKQPVEGLFCNYSHRVCMQNRVDGSEYCIKHVLEDKTLPYKQCSFVSGKTGKRCCNAAPKSDRKDGYCNEHSRRAAVIRQRVSRKRRPPETAESLLEELDHYRPGSSVETTHSKLRRSLDSVASRVLDYASSSDSDTESPLVDQAWRGDVESDAESIDSEQEDPLKHAGVYTADEVTLIMRDKLIRLQSLYIDQFKRLQHVMKEKRRKYLHTHKQERDTLGGLRSYKDLPATRDKYSKLKSLKRYHKRYGSEALLHRQSKQRRIAVSEGANYKPPSHPKCIDVNEGTKCLQRTVPLSKYCAKHILKDPQQVLYKPCSFANGNCGRPVAVISTHIYCSYHTPLLDIESRLPVKTEVHDEEITITDVEIEQQAGTEPTDQKRTEDKLKAAASTQLESESTDDRMETISEAPLEDSEDLQSGADPKQKLNIPTTVLDSFDN
ncbi:hypothetical protein ScPMuIL_012567 [Solemya velum]